MVLAVYGKHPAKGDFLEHGIPAALKAPLESWLDEVLAQARAELGSSWEQVWRNAPLIRFWVGEAVWGLPVVGVMAASQDRVGRRFPLMLFCTGADAARVPAPTIGDDGGWYDQIAAHLVAQLAMRDLAVPSDLLVGALVPADLGTPEPGPDSFWAVRPGASVADLLADIALTDHRRAAAGRSYWWVVGQPALAEQGEDPASTAARAEGAPLDEPQSADKEAAETGPDRCADQDGPKDDEAPGAADSLWDVPDDPVDDGSPFAAVGGLRLFAAPMAADPALWADTGPIPDKAQEPPAPRVFQSQVWAGSGLPPSTVLAWFFRGVTENGEL